MKKNINRDIFPLVISLLLLTTSIGISIFTDYALSHKHYVGLLLVVLSTVLYFKNKEIYRYIFGFTLLLGTGGVIDLFFINTRVETGLFNIPFLNFNPILLTLLILFLVLNKQLIDRLFPNTNPTEINESKEKEKKEARIKTFELKFENKPESELKAITNLNNVYIDEARIAANRILKKKYLS